MRLRRGRSHSATAIPPRCTCGGRGSRSHHAAPCCSRSWSTIRLAIPTASRRMRPPKPSANGFSESCGSLSSGKTRSTTTSWSAPDGRFGAAAPANFPASSTRSRAAARCRSRPSGSEFPPREATSTRSRFSSERQHSKSQLGSRGTARCIPMAAGR